MSRGCSRLMRKAMGGITVVELTVASVLLGVLFYCIYGLLSPGLKAWRESDVKVAIQQNTLLGMYRLINEVKETNRFSVAVDNYDVPYQRISSIICFLSSRNNRGDLVTKKIFCGGEWMDTGEPEWQKYVIYYLDDRERIRRYETPVNASYSPPYKEYREVDSMMMKFRPVDMVHLDNLSSDSVVARNISKLRLGSSVDTESEKMAVNVMITAYDPSGSVKDYSTSLQTTVGVRYNEED